MTNIELADNLVEEHINELRQTFINCFSPPSDVDCILSAKLYQTIYDHHGLASNGWAEEKHSTLVDELLEFFNREKQLPPYRFKEFLEDHVENY